MNDFNDNNEIKRANNTNGFYTPYYLENSNTSNSQNYSNVNPNNPNGASNCNNGYQSNNSVNYNQGVNYHFNNGINYNVNPNMYQRNNQQVNHCFNNSNNNSHNNSYGSYFNYNYGNPNVNNQNAYNQNVGYTNNVNASSATMANSFNPSIGINSFVNPSSSVYNKNLLNNVVNNSNGVTAYVTSNKKRDDFFKTQKRLNSRNYQLYRSLSKSKRAILILSFTAIIIFVASYYFISYATYVPEKVTYEPVSFETNQNVLNMASIISENMNINTFKETVNEQRVVEFPIIYTTYDKLPEGEEQIKTEGKTGVSKVVSVRTYEDNEVVDENIIEQVILTEPVAQEIQIGTSKFLKQFQVHLNDLMYTTVDAILYQAPDLASTNLGTVPSTYDVTLLDLADGFCKVKYETKEGYIETSKLTSAAVAPEIVEKARLRRILKDVSLNMDLNKKSGLALSDFKKICEGNPSDTYKIFEQNYEAFYNVEQKYEVNGVFLIALAIHESGWGTSQIAQDKKNLFGYGSYDRDPYNMSYTFETYQEGIELVAKVLKKSYLNPKDTPIYDNEVATGQYYNGPNVKGINTRYSTDSSWHTKVYSYIKMLYNKLDSTKQIQVAEEETSTTTTTPSTSTNTNTTNTNTTTSSTNSTNVTNTTTVNNTVTTY